MLHDAEEDTDYDLSQIKNDFGEVVAGLVDGVSKFRRLLEQGAVYIDDKRINGGDEIQLIKELVVRVGKRRYMRLVK